MVPDLIRDSFFGHAVRLASANRLFTYPEERDPSVAEAYYNHEKTLNLSLYGETKPHKVIQPAKDVKEKGSEPTLPEPKERTPHGRRTSLSSASTETGALPQPRPQTSSPEDVEPGHNTTATVVDWSDNDQENPRNWSRAKRYFVTFQICLLTMGVYSGSAIYTPAIPFIEEQFQVSETVAILGLCLFVAGYGLGPMVFAPLSEMPQIGRTPIYIITLAIFVALQVPTALSSNIGMLLGFRFLTGLFGSPVLATGGATLADIYRPQKQAYALVLWGMAAVIGPSLGPAMSGFAVLAKGWNWSIWELCWLSGFVLLILVFLLPETSSTNILYRRTHRLRKLTGEHLTCEPMLMAESMTGKDIVMMVLVRPITLNFQEPMVFFCNLYIALIYGLLYIWFESFPLTFLEIYGFPPGTFTLTYLGILAGALVVVPPLFAYFYFFQEKQFDSKGTIQPEKRLVPAMVGCFTIPICLFWFGWSARPSVHWIMPIIGSAWFGIGSMCLFISILTYLGDAYPDYIASVYAGNDLFRSSFGAGFPVFATAMYRKLGVDWASSTLGFISVAFIPIPFVLYKYGQTLRINHSSFARKDI